MKLKLGAAGAIALALIAGPVAAQDSDQPVQDQEQVAPDQQAPDQQAQEQPPQDQQPVAESPASLPEQVTELLKDTRPARDLDENDLRRRKKAVSRALRNDNLPGDVRQQLQAMADADSAELEQRTSATQQGDATAPAEAPKVETPVAQTQDAAEPPVPAPVAELPREVTDILDDSRPLADLSDEELGSRAKKARMLSKDAGLPDDVRGRIAEIGRAARQELQRREQAANAPAAEPPAPTEETVLAPPRKPKPGIVAPPVVEPTVPGENVVVAPAAKPTAKPVKPKPPVIAAPAVPPVPPKKTATVPPRKPPGAARQQGAGENGVVADPGLAKAPVPPVKRRPGAVRDDNQAGAVTPPPPPKPPVPTQAETKELDGNTGNPAAEKAARAYLNDRRPAKELSDEQLRERLDGIRELMAGNQLSVETERALREKLRAERDILRNRVAAEKDSNQQPGQGANGGGQGQTANGRPVNRDGKPRNGTGLPQPHVGGNNPPEVSDREVLRDRRPSDDLDTTELRRRINVYITLDRSQDAEDYDEETRAAWRDTVRRDREVLRRRMLEDRQARRDEMSRNNHYEVDIQNEYVGDEPDVPDDIFAAEVDDQDIERVLVAAPKRRVSRRITLDEIADEPRLREVMPRVEVDTIHFGFNEAFLREEEVDYLETIATVIERVLSRHPDELFLIEGHTDAVGSDAYNITLSKARADAVKRALTTYFVIPSRNLRTVGLGERYLKIPTAEAEAENRRVSISRATPLLGEAE